jgi:VCBS repeat-containing protein
MVNDRTNDITAMKDGKTVWTGRITVAADGKSRTVTINSTGADGKKVKGKAVYDKE